jgi:AcrR family transcriptional regulator
MIANEAGVAQALLHYHFHNKDRLFEAVFERRSNAASGHRGQMLSELMEREPNPSLESVLSVLFIPHQESAEPGSNLGGYFQLVAAVGVGSDARSKDLIARYFDPIAHRFIQAFLQAVPGLTPEKAVWSYLFAIGSRMQAQAKNDRADRLCHTLGLKKLEPFELLVPFVAAGIRSMVK